MKKINKGITALLASALLVLTGCTKFHDGGGSVWQGGTWILPTITILATIFFGYKTYKASTSGSNIIESGAITDKEGGNVPFYETGWFYFAVGSLIASVFIIANVISNR
jgi:hypothetical protein